MDYEVEYNNRARVPEHPAIFERWAHASAAFRGAAVAADLGVPYGPGPRQVLDIFWPSPDRQAPVALFIHGGYWQSLHPRDFSFAAAGCLAHGVALALAGYDLAPHVPVATILAQTRAAAITLYRLVGRRIAVSGHSAGGHLAAALTATAWREIDVDTPDDLIPAGIGLSGVYELEPLIATQINKALRLDPEEARRLSPALWTVPAGRTFEAFVGGAESAEFLRQSRDLAVTWRAQGTLTAHHEVPGANHFTVVDGLADPSSHMVRRLAEMARAAAE
ncbi:alpha/beta hydrolase [Xanthobacter dioxanivorans]|uniref:Alpha/beta hydrolase n=1 Tax=Xanthobacter dioxanivorans TaxID=2528964 RepID=A0A974PRQ3_9HYPH|nr:alpha/beta hydrolase [Xanthobacter dioxanivorans]QRG08241.1 alpha/beta hydrolase [Xanthobacter dioxanivorans]